MLKNNFKFYGFLTSIALLAAAIVYWQNLFLFSKISFRPEWVKYLPDPLVANWLIVFICLLFPAFAYKTKKETIQAILLSATIAPLFALIFRAFNQGDNLENMLMQYIFIILFSVILPTLVTIIFTAIRFKYRNNK
jgi:hypothetical protein